MMVDGGYNAAFAKLKADADGIVMDDEDVTCDWIFGCWKTFLPSIAPRLESLMMDAPRKSVRFQLEDNTTHLVPARPPKDDADYQSLFVGGNEIRYTELDMEATAMYFRRLYRLERVPTDDQHDQDILVTSSRLRLDEVSTIGLEWLIWPDDRWKRRHDIIEALQRYSNKSLAYACQSISKISIKKARQRAEWVVHELKSSSDHAISPCTNKMAKDQTEARRGIDLQMLFQKGILMSSREAVVGDRRETCCSGPPVPKEIFIPVPVCTTPAA